MTYEAAIRPVTAIRTKLSRQQLTGFWGAWAGWTLDGMDSVIYALVLGPALTELLPKSGVKVTPANVGSVGSILFALFLVGWGLSFVWGPIADQFGRTRVLAATIFVYAIFTGAAAFSQTVWQLGLFRLLAGIGIGGEWALAAGRSPQDGRRLSPDWLLRGLSTCFGSQLRGCSTLWLARHVLVRPDASSRSGHGLVARERARELATKV
jgi:MFS family permease